MKIQYRAFYICSILIICGFVMLIFKGCGGNEDGEEALSSTEGYDSSTLILGLNPPNGAAYDDVFFQDYGTNPFIDTEDDNLSTFAMDVDTASYSVTRRYLRDGNLPPREAVRVEEFVNSFDYDYMLPSDGAFSINIEGASTPYVENTRYQLLRIGIQGRSVSDENRKDATLTFVLDVSGSMAMENRLGLVKRSLTLLVEQLRPGDKVGIVVYGTDARIVLPHTGVEARGEILEAINALEPEGVTNAEAGLQLGYSLALRRARAGGLNRVILCSDGVANVGETGADAILKKIRSYVEEGITLTTVGFGMGNFNDVLMEQLANNGNGSYVYVDSLNEAKRVFVENLTGTLQLIAKDAKVQVEFNTQNVSRFRLLGYENRRLEHEDFADDDVDAGEIGSGHSVTALYEIKLHEGAAGHLAKVSIRYEDPDTYSVSEISEDISSISLKSTFEEASAQFQLAASVAEFAEILRESYWAQDGSLETVLQNIQRIRSDFSNNQVEELTSMVNAAISLKTSEREDRF